MKKFLLLAIIALITCTTAAGQNMFSGSTDLKVIAKEWEKTTLNGVANGSLVTPKVLCEGVASEISFQN